ncbi:scabin-related ADP-ribosyltransferase [Streptomyces luteireticuli]|uniref:scabin-related ADP-ribosyltransferase n=1 Tax=Streptomyces luteireticuli TaxID=173858 RepID=UPI0031D71CBB
MIATALGALAAGAGDALALGPGGTDGSGTFVVTAPPEGGAAGPPAPPPPPPAGFRPTPPKGPEIPARTTDPRVLGVAADPRVDVERISPKPVWRTERGPLYRFDSRPPEEIFKTGFSPREAGLRNGDLRGYQGNNQESMFVSTTDKAWLGGGKFGKKGMWRYTIEAPHGVDVNATLGSTAGYAGEREIAFPGGIKPVYIKGAEQVENVHYGQGEPPAGTFGEFRANAAFNAAAAAGAACVTGSTGSGSGRAKRSAELCDPGTEGTSEKAPEKTPEETSTSPAAAERDPAEIAELNRARLGRHGKDVEYVTSLDEFDKNPKALLSPLRKTNRLLNAAKDAELGAEDFGKFSTQVGTAFGHDLRAMETLSTDSGLLARVGSKLGRAGSIGMKVLPYVGIAATGYAIAEDVKTGDYANLAFDTVAEGMQIAMVAQPELAPVLEPLLLAEQGVQLIYNAIHEAVLEARQAAADHAKWRGAAGDLVKERDQQWRAHLAAVAKDKIAPHLDRKLGAAFAADRHTLDKWAQAKKKAIAEVAEKSRSRASSDGDKQRIRDHEAKLLKKIDDEVRKQRESRATAYREQALKIAEHTLASTLTPEPAKDGELLTRGEFGDEGADTRSAFDAFNERFDEKVTWPYMKQLSDRMAAERAPYRNYAMMTSLFTPALVPLELLQSADRPSPKHQRIMLEHKLQEIRKALALEGRASLPTDEIKPILSANTPRLQP